ncbi:MAG: helix-turn-helix domain-containing protein [Proteobacteria bacterium]|nr:helix-turn-helix domain-containing protein [Pseudomonadota bacterium]
MILLAVHILVVLAKMLRTGGIEAIIAENLLLKQQLILLGRSRRKAPNLRTSNRFILGGLSLFISARRRLSVAVIIRPSALLKFHRVLVKRKYRRLFCNSGHTKPGPKGPSRELIAAIVELKQRNPRYGCPRIAYIISLTFGTAINKYVVRRVLAKHCKPKPGNTQSPSWLSLLGHSKDSLWSTDLFRCESLTLKSYWVLVVIPISSLEGESENPGCDRNQKCSVRPHITSVHRTSDRHHSTRISGSRAFLELSRS